MYAQYLWFAIPIAFASIQGFELVALLGRIAGIESRSYMLGYSIQQSIYVCTRFFVLLLLPALGYMIDHGIAPHSFRLLIHLSLGLAGIVSLLILFSIRPLVSYFSKVISSFRTRPSLIRAFLFAFFAKSKLEEDEHEYLNIFRAQYEGVVSLLFLSSIVYWVYSLGSFLTFYVALFFPDHRATLTQLSGIVNALGTVLLTFVVEPKVSRSIDDLNPEAVSLVMAMFWGRLVAILFLGHLALLLLPD